MGRSHHECRATGEAATNRPGRLIVPAETIAAACANKAPDLFGHPRGLIYLLATEAFERFSYYGMQTLLVLYMAGYLLHPGTVEQVHGFAAFRTVIESVTGKLSIQALATQIMGLYTGLVYLTPVAGGFIGDRWLGRRRAVVLGLALMVAGHFLMASETMFVLALATLASGGALLKGNVAAQVGALYAPHDSRRDRAFAVFYMAINGGGMLAPLVCGTLGEVYGWHYGFASAGVFMLVGLAVYLAGLRHIPPDATAQDRASRPAQKVRPAAQLVAFAIIWLVAVLFWVCISQGWNTYMLWVRDHVDRVAFSHIIPVTWFSSLDAFTGVALAPAVLTIWRRQAAKGSEPHDLTKISIGCAVYAACLLGLASGGFGPVQASVLWVFVCSCVGAFGYLYVAPVMISLVSRAVPPEITGTAIAVYYTSIFARSLISGWLGRFYGVVSDAAFWMIHAGIVASGSLIVLSLRGFLTRALDD
jgi:POT family proton-dependent oligopeptide transporter